MITHSTDEKSCTSLPERYVEHFFDQLASKQAQAVVSGLCLTLATIISRASSTDTQERLLSFLSKLLLEKLSYSTKKAEFVTISAASSSAAKLLRNSVAEIKQEADLDKISQYKPIISGCKLLSASCKHILKCDWSRTQSAVLYLQTLINHRNVSLAGAARGAYIAALKFFSKSAQEGSIPDNLVKSILNEIIPFLMDTSTQDTASAKQLSFHLKSLSILIPIFAKQPPNQDPLRILLWVVEEIVRLTSKISENPVPPNAYCLTELLESSLNILAESSPPLSSKMRESLLGVLKSGIISCFQAYPHLSQASTEPTARAIVNIINRTAGDDDMAKVLDEAFYHVVLQTCSHSPLDLDASDSDAEGASEEEKEAKEDNFEIVRQPSSSSQPKIAIPLPSFRDHLPLWRYLLGLPAGIRRKESYLSIPPHCSSLILRLLLNSSLSIVERLDFSYDEVGMDTPDLESQVNVRNPHDVLLLSNIAAFLEHILPDCSVDSLNGTVSSFLQTSLQLVRKYPLLSGLYHLLKMAILLSKKSGFFKSTESTLENQLRSFGQLLIDSFPPIGALSGDDLSIARSACLLSFPLSAFDHSNINKIGHTISSISQLAAFKERCATLAMDIASAVEAWLDDAREDSSFYSVAVRALVPGLVSLLSANHDVSTTTKVSLPLFDRRSRRSHQRTELRRILRGLSKRPIRSNLDPPIREAQVKVIEIIGRNVFHWNLLNSEQLSDEVDDNFANILPTGRGVFNDLILHLPFPDLRPYIRLSDVRLFFESLLGPIGFSRQARVSAAEYLHEYIVHGLINQRSDPNESIESSDATYWLLLFHLVFILGADSDPLIRRLFRCLAFQLVHWHAGYSNAGLCQTKLLQEVMLRILHLSPPEDDICGVIESNWPIPESVGTLRTKLASVCLRDFLLWMNPETPGTKRRRASLGSETFDDLLRLILDGLCVEGSASRKSNRKEEFQLLSERSELARKYIYVLIDAFKKPGRNWTPATLKRSVDLLTDQIKRYPDDLVLEDTSIESKRPRLTRTAPGKPNIISLKPPLWKSASISSCVKSLLLECRDPVNTKSFQELVEQITSASNLQLTPQILSTTEALISMFEWNLDATTGFLCCLDNYSWLISSNLLSSPSFLEAIKLPESSIIAHLGMYCSSLGRLPPGGSVTILNFLFAILSSKPRVDLSAVFSGNHSIWNFLVQCLLIPPNRDIQLDDNVAVSLLKLLSKRDITFLTTSICQFLESKGFSKGTTDFKPILLHESVADIFLNISRLLTNVKRDIGFHDLFSAYISPESLQDLLGKLKEESLVSSEMSSKLVQSIFSIAASFKYQIFFDVELFSKLTGQSDRYSIPPVTLLTILGLNQESQVPPDSPNVVVSILLKFLSVYSRDSNRQVLLDGCWLVAIIWLIMHLITSGYRIRTNQFCEGITNAWKQCIEPLLQCKDFENSLCVDLLESVISLSQVELDRNIFIAAYFDLLKDETVKVSSKVKNLDMLAFFLQSEITPTTFSLSNERRDEIVEAVKYLLASSLPLDLEEISSSPVKLAECSTLLKSVLSLLKSISCPEAIRMLTTTFCRYDTHFMDEELEESLISAMKRIWARPLDQERVMNSVLDGFEQAVSSANPSPALIKFWHRYFYKFLKPLLLSVSPSALERLAVRNIVKWIQILETSDSEIGVTVTSWLWRLLNRSVIFYLLVSIYNRLSRTLLHGLSVGGVGSVLKAFLGPAKMDLLQSGQIKGTELTATIIKKACASLQDQLLPPPGTSLTDDLKPVASTLKRTLWSSNLASLVAAVSATQTQEKAYNYVLVCGPLSRFFPAETSFSFPRRRSGKYRSAFIELREQFWLPTEREPYLNRPGLESSSNDLPLRQKNKSSGLLQGSSFSMEVNRLMRASGTQIICGSSADFKKPLSPRASATPSSTTLPPEFRPTEEVEMKPTYIKLEVDALNTSPLTVTFVGLLKHMFQLGLFKGGKSSDMPQVLKFLYDQFNSNSSNENVRAFVVKLVINCPEAFKPFSQHWLPLLLTYFSDGAEALLDSSGLSSLAIDICLLLAEWGRSNILPTTEMEKSTAQQVFAHLVKHAWIEISGEGDADIPEGVASALKHNLELIQLLAESWLPAGVQIPYRWLTSFLKFCGEFTSIMSSVDMNLSGYPVELVSKPFDPAVGLCLLAISDQGTPIASVFFFAKSQMPIFSEGGAPYFPSLSSRFGDNADCDRNDYGRVCSVLKGVARRSSRRTSKLEGQQTSGFQSPVVQNASDPLPKIHSREFVSILLQYLHESQKTLLTAAWECSALLASKFTPSQSSTSNPSAGSVLQSRGLNILSLSEFPFDLHPLITELWSTVTGLNPVQRRKRPSDAPNASIIEAACAAATHWSVLALHLTNNLLATGISENIEPTTFSHCLRMFTKLIENLNENKLEIAVEQTVKVEILQNIANSNIFEMIKLGTTVVLFHGAMLILRIVQFVKSIPLNTQEFDVEARRKLVLHFLETLASTLIRPNSTPQSRRVVYRIFIEARKNERGSETHEIEEICNLGLSYGLCAEDDDQLRRQLRKYVSEHCFNSSSIPSLSTSVSRCLLTFQLLGSGHHSNIDDQVLMSGIGRHLVSTSLELLLEPAVKSAEFRHPFRQSPLDPNYPFTDVGFTRTSVSLSQSLLDPVVLSGTQQLKRSQTQLLGTAAVSATLALPTGDTTQTQLLETQNMPSTSVFTQFVETPSNPVIPKRIFSPAFGGPKAHGKSRAVSFGQLSPVEQLRQKFLFAASLAAQTSESAPTSGNSVREFFKQRTIQRQHAEISAAYSSSSFDESETSSRLCRRHRIGALPDVETLTPEAILKPLFQLAKSDSSICGSTLLGLVLESIVASLESGADDIFLKGLGASLAGLLIRGDVDQSTICLSLIWNLGSGLETKGVILALLPEPMVLAARAISARRPDIGVLVMEEALCALAMKQPFYDTITLSPWTSKRRRFYRSAMPTFILPQEEFEVVSSETGNTTTITVAVCWWQLTRLYASVGRSEEVLGWLCDRWATGSSSTRFLEHLGGAIVAKGSGDYEGAVSQLKQVLRTSKDDHESEPDTSNSMDVDEADSNLWVPRPIGLNAELRLVCREELLHCLSCLGSWQDLDIYALDFAKDLDVSQTSDSSSSVDEASASNSFKEEFASLWKEPYLADTILPQIIHSRLQLCLSSEINKLLSHSGPDTSDELTNFSRIMESGLQSASNDFELKYAYELALLSIFYEDYNKAQFRCKGAFKHLVQTWSSEEDMEERFHKIQLLTELKEYLEALTNSGQLSSEENLLPAIVDFRLACCNEFLLCGNARRALNHLPSLHQLIRKIDHDNQYRRLAWCTAFSRAWMSEFTRNVIFCSDAAEKGEKRSLELENGLEQCLSSLSQCIEVHDSLQVHPSTESVDLNIAQFSHAISMAQVLSAFHDLQASGRLSNGGSKDLTSSLRSSLQSRFSKIHGMEEIGENADFLQASAFVFFKRCVDLATGIHSADAGESVSPETALCRLNLLAYKPDEALLEVANFCNSRIDDDTVDRDSYTETFSRSVLTAMRMGSEGGRIRFGRVLQLEVARCTSSPTYDASVFCSLTKDLPPWTFSQWFDRLLAAPIEGGTALVMDILLRISQKFPQALALPFRVLMTSFCDWNSAEQSSFEHFMAKLTKDGKADAAPIFSALFEAFSRHTNLHRFLGELEYLDDPDLVFRDWANNYARKAIHSNTSNSADLVASCSSLLKGGLLRVAPNDLRFEGDSSGTGDPQTEWQIAAANLSSIIQKEFGRNCERISTITPAEFDIAVQRITSTFQKFNPKDSKLIHFSHWLANYSSDENDPIEMPGQRLNSASEMKPRITIKHVDPNVKVLTSLRRPKLIRLLGSDGRWRRWLVKGGEDLRQDSCIQRLLDFMNYAISSKAVCSSSTGTTGITPLQTYVVAPVSSQRGIIQWLDGTTTLSTFCMEAMSAKEAERFSSEKSALDTEISRQQGDDLLWSSGNESSASLAVSHFTDLENFVHSLRLIRRGLSKSVATSAEHFAALRYRFITSLATLSAVHFILGIGDRHLGNFLLDRSTGSLVGIDFGYAFGVGLSFPTPEYVPIRLTSSLRELLEPSGPAGLFGSTLSRTLASLRHNSSLFLPSLQTFIEDKSTTHWSLFSERYNQSEEEYQRSRLSLIRRKLIGHCPAELLIDDLRTRFGSREWFDRFEKIARASVEDNVNSRGPFPPSEQTRRLVCLSTCPELLARMHSGWNAAI
ncbi:hypothetical protein Aperf_G00000086515 [Anoplocephala perfoliata]